MKKFLLLFITFLPVCTRIFGGTFEPTATMRSETMFLVQILEQIHYLKKPLKSLDVAQLLRDYISSLDSQKMFFTQNDVDYFIQNYRHSLELLWRGGSLIPGFEIYQKAQQLVKTRMSKIQRRLEMNFDFSTNATYTYDRKNAEWAKNPFVLDALWDKRLQHELENEMLSSTPKNLDVIDATNELKKDTPPVITHAKALENITQARKTLQNRYENFYKHFSSLEPIDIQEIYSNSLTQRYDPHTTFFSANSMEDFSISLKNSLVGIGTYLSEDNGDCIIKEVLPGGPAEHCGVLKAGDKILSVAQGNKKFVSIQGMKLRNAVKLIRGPKDTKVRLLIQPASDPSERKTIELIREEIKLENNLASAKVYSGIKYGQFHRIGIIDLPMFYGTDNTSGKHTNTLSHDVKELIEKLKTYHVEGIILDMRRNGGGLLSEAINLAGLFLNNCPVVQIKDTQGNKVSEKARENTCIWTGPLIILTSRFSASASEIVAGALKCLNRALIFGEQTTHGKGTVQAILELDKLSTFAGFYTKLGAVKVTVQKWYLPDGQSTQLKGVHSDLSLPSIYDCLPISEADLSYVLPWDSISPMDLSVCKHDPSCQVITPALKHYLRQALHVRQRQLPMYAWNEKQVSWFRQKYTQTEVTLNLDERIKNVNEERNFQKTLDDSLKTFVTYTPCYQYIYLQGLQIHKKPTALFDIFEYESIQQMLDILHCLKIHHTCNYVWTYVLNYPQQQRVF